MTVYVVYYKMYIHIIQAFIEIKDLIPWIVIITNLTKMKYLF